MAFRQKGLRFTGSAKPGPPLRTPPPSARVSGFLPGAQARGSRSGLRRESTDGAVDAPWWCNTEAINEDRMERLFQVWSQPLWSRCQTLEAACNQLARRLDAIEPCMAETKALESQLNTLGVSVLACSEAVRKRLMQCEEKSETPADLPDVFADSLQKLRRVQSEKQASQMPSGCSSSNMHGHSAEPGKLKTHFAKALKCRSATAAERLNSAPAISEEGHRMLTSGTNGIEGGFVHSSAAEGISFHTRAACLEQTLPQDSAELQKQRQRQPKQQQQSLSEHKGGLLQVVSRPLLHNAGSARLASEPMHVIGKDSPRMTWRQQSQQWGSSTTSSDSHTLQTASWAGSSFHSMV